MRNAFGVDTSTEAKKGGITGNIYSYYVILEPNPISDQQKHSKRVEYQHVTMLQTEGSLEYSNTYSVSISYLD
jgi:hypothetical protein